MNEKLIYIANIRFPTEKAHGIQIVKMCEAFAGEGMDVELIVSSRKTPICEDPFEYYNVKRNFKVKKLWCVDSIKYGRVGFLFESFTFGLSVKIFSLFKGGIFYTRDEYIAFILRCMGKKVIWESHTGQKNFFVRMLVRMEVPIVVITRSLAEVYEKMGVLHKNIYVAPDGVDIEQFDIKENREEARSILGFKNSEKIILYTGHLYSWKGADILAESAKLLPKDIKVYFIGGTDGDILSFKKKYWEVENIKILGRKPHKEMPLYMRAADILVIPNSAKEDISRLYTSPMKLFEYMASGTPIISSDLPSLREVLDESDAFFFFPDDAKDLSCAILNAFSDVQKTAKKAGQAFKKALKYGWRRRAENILEFYRNTV